MNRAGWLGAAILLLAVSFVWFLRAPVQVRGESVAGGSARGLAPSPSAADALSARPFRLVFPHLADGPAGDLSIRFGVLLINRSGYAARGEVRLRRADGRRWTPPSNLGSASEFEFQLGPGQILRLDSLGGPELGLGWAEVRSDRELFGSGIYRVVDPSGRVSETGIGDSPPSLHQLIFFQSEESIDTGLAICNPSDANPAQLLFQLRSLSGNLLAERRETLGPLAQIALLAGQIFDPGSVPAGRGVLSIESDRDVSALTLRTRGANFTSLPTVPAVQGPGSPSELLFARIGDGIFGGFTFQTSLLLLNPSDTPSEATVEFFSADGAPLEMTFQGRTDHVFSAPLPARGAVAWTAQASDRQGVVGWARVRGSGTLGGAAAFAIREVASGRFLSEVGVPDSKPSPAPEIAVQESTAASTGLALTNPSDEDLLVRLRLQRDSSGADPGPPSTRTIALPARGHWGAFVPELFPGAGSAAGEWRGSIEAYAYVEEYGEDVPAPVAGLTLLARGVSLTTMPAALPPAKPLPLSAWDEPVSEQLANMTLDEKIGQMTLPDTSFLADQEDIRTYFLGAVLSGGGSDPSGNSRADWADQYDRFRRTALRTRLGIPLLYGVDAVHGHSNVEGAVIFPHNIGLGATRDTQLVERVARVTASEVRATGLNWTYSPCVAVPRDERWGRTYEGFGEDPELVREMAAAAVRGYQGPSLNGPLSAVACAKHYLGDGGTVWGTGIPIDQGDVRLSEPELRRIHLPGYLGALEAGAASIMASFSAFNGVRMSGNRRLLTEVLKDELGFEGLLVSDWGAIDHLPGDFRSDVRTAVNAGLDMIMVPDRYPEFFQTLRALANSGEVPMSRVDDAVRRILRVKMAAGLWDAPLLADPGAVERFGSAPHRELAREAVRRSLVLLQNRDGVLPLAKSLSRITVAGRNADDLGNQCGGWTIDWQGGSGRLTEGTTILEGIRAAVSPHTEIHHSPDGSDAAGSDVAIVVVGETPYAEFVGDSNDLSLSPADRTALDAARGAGIPVVLVIVSGRPMILGSALDQADAILAAWLPGTEGRGVADVLFGVFAPTGRLPCSWPRNMAQIPVNYGDPAYDPLFEYGFGLTY